MLYFGQECAAEILTSWRSAAQLYRKLLALGSQRFIDNIFGLTRANFGEKRRSGSRKLQRIDTNLRTLRNLQREPVQT